MNSKDWFWAIVEAVIWYGFFYYLLYTIKSPVVLWQSALILLGLAYLGTITCPWVRNTEAWKKLQRKKK